MIYLVLKHLHIALVAMSGTHFLTRAYLDWGGYAWRGTRLWRTLPHINDTLLLLSGMTLAWLSHQYPFVASWLTAKFFLLLVYIVCGSLALREALSTPWRLLAGGGAISAFTLLVGVALFKTTWL